MKLQTLLSFLLSSSLSLAQSYPECTRELAQTDACLAVINANACYNQFKFNNAQALQCVDGANDAERKKKVCQCCTCVGTVMCNWATKQKYC